MPVLPRASLPPCINVVALNSGAEMEHASSVSFQRLLFLSVFQCCFPSNAEEELLMCWVGVELQTRCDFYHSAPATMV